MTDQMTGAEDAKREKGSEPEPPDLPTKAQQHFEQAHAYEAKEDFEKALSECDLAILLAPTWAEPHNLRGIVLDALGKRREAVAAYRQAIRIDPTFREAQDNKFEAERELVLEEANRKPRKTPVYRPGCVVAAAI